MTSPDNPFSPLDIREAGPDERDTVVTLWKKCGLTRPWNDAERDFEYALAGAASTVLVGVADGQIVASVMVGHDGHRGGIYYMSTSPDHRDRGYGRDVMNAVEAWLKDRGVPKLNVLVRQSNDQVIGFYQRLGYAVEPQVQMGKRMDG